MRKRTLVWTLVASVSLFVVAVWGAVAWHEYGLWATAASAACTSGLVIHLLRRTGQ